MEVLLWGGLIALLIVGAISTMAEQSRREETRDSMPNYRATQSFEPKHWEKSKTGISVDETQAKVCLIDHAHPDPYRVVSYADILESEIIEDGHSVTKTSRGSQIVGGLVGAALLNAPGMIVGALSGTKVTKEKVTSIDLRVVVKDTARPVHTIRFLTTETMKGSAIYRQAAEKAQRWHAILSIIVQQATAAPSAQAALRDAGQRTAPNARRAVR